MIDQEILQQCQKVKAFLFNWQASLCEALEKIDSEAKFASFPWEKEHFGKGLTRVLEQGVVIEKGGVNFSHITGTHLPPAATSKRPQLHNAAFEVMGVSTVIHPFNPYAPTSHANLRFFVATPKNAAPIWWFGGGFDLTPYYGFVEDCRFWHQMAKDACDLLSPESYTHYKKWCDEYFYLKHRQEPRGIGGIFFDDVNEKGFDHSFAFIQQVAANFTEAYANILAKRKNHLFTEKHKQFQLYRRGRYVEFNLVWDRGTLFGLQTEGRTESILMSLPPEVTWRYDWQPETGSEEAQLYRDFLIAKDWLAK